MVDLASDQAHIQCNDRAADFTEAIERWRAADRATAPPSEPPSVEPVAEEEPGGDADGNPQVSDMIAPVGEAVLSSPDTGQYIDLTENLPGAAARRQALALKAERPVYTRIARLLGMRTDERAWRIGASGEELVAAQLRKLEPNGWYAIHAIKVGENGSDIDHLVIGPGGVLTLNAKNHKGAKIWVAGNTFLVNGQYHPYIRNSRHEARRASRLLSQVLGFEVPVLGAVAVVNADSFTVKTMPEDVHVVWRYGLASWLRSLPIELGSDLVEAVYDVARRSTTWQADTRTAPTRRGQRL